MTGFLIFAWLTLNALLAEPAPLALAEPKLTELEYNLQQHECSLGALWQPGRPQFDFGWDPVAPSRCLQDQLSQQYGNSSSQLDQLIKHAAPDSISRRSVGQAVADQLGLDWPTPRWPALVFLGGAMACMLTSTVAHLFGCCSEHLGKLMWRLDYSGITILIVTSFFPPVYYGFMCQPFWRNVYLGITTVVGRDPYIQQAVKVSSYCTCYCNLFCSSTCTGSQVSLSCVLGIGWTQAVILWPPGMGSTGLSPAVRPHTSIAISPAFT